MLTNPEKIAVLKRIFQEDIEEFGKFFFPHHLSLETPTFHKEIYKLYQSDIKKIAIAAPRGHAKSTITDVVYLAWIICNNKANFILLISDTYSQSVLFLDSLKSEFENNDLLQEFYGKFESNSWSEGEIVANNVMVKAMGAGMKVRGLKYQQYRPDLAIVDDLENDEMVESKERREKLERWVNAALLPALEPKRSRVVFIGTILHFESLLSKLVDPLRYTDFTKKIYKAINPWGVLWEEHLNIRDLEKIKAEYIERGQGYLFYQEYQNEPISAENQKFKPEKFKYYEANEMELASRELVNYITIDRAYSLEKLADFTGIIVLSVDNDNNWYVRMAERFKGTEKDLIDKIFDLQSYFKPKKIGIEQKAYEYTIKPALTDRMRQTNTFFNIEELRDLGKGKNVRIEGLVPRFEAGTIFLKREQVDLIDELIKFPKGGHDDLIDALAYNLQLAERTALGQSARIYRPSNLNRSANYQPKPLI